MQEKSNLDKIAITKTNISFYSLSIIYLKEEEKLLPRDEISFIIYRSLIVNIFLRSFIFYSQENILPVNISTYTEQLKSSIQFYVKNA
jgi:hypothetical protein